MSLNDPYWLTAAAAGWLGCLSTTAMVDGYLSCHVRGGGGPSLRMLEQVVRYVFLLLLLCKVFDQTTSNEFQAKTISVKHHSPSSMNLLVNASLFTRILGLGLRLHNTQEHVRRKRIPCEKLVSVLKSSLLLAELS